MGCLPRASHLWSPSWLKVGMRDSLSDWLSGQMNERSGQPLTQSYKGSKEGESRCSVRDSGWKAEGLSVFLDLRCFPNGWSSFSPVPWPLKRQMPTRCSAPPCLLTWPRSRMKQSPVLKLSQLSARSVARMFFFPFTWYSFLMAAGAAPGEVL